MSSFYSGFATGNREFTTFIYIATVVAFFAFYFAFWKMYLKNKLKAKDVKLVVGITCAILLFSYPAMLSYDIFNYIFSAKVLFYYHENPYLIMPVQFLGDPFLSFTHAANKIALYGPSWIIASGLPYILGFGNFILTILNLKLLVVFFYLATSWMIYKISKDLLPVILFSLNPLVIVETLVSGHNDIVMVFLALCGIFLLSRKKVFSSFIFLILSILIKYSTLFLLPVFLYVSFLQKNKKSINWSKIYSFCAVLMMTAFFLSPIREEIYPWYAIWFLPFAVLQKNRLVLYISISFSLSLLFRYVPFMFLGIHDGPAPITKMLVTFVPPLIVLFWYLLSKKLWKWKLM
ncbi:MAG: hypothetical protein WD967_02115 [Candidatus Levyibacteriota bacterium]